MTADPSGRAGEVQRPPHKVVVIAISQRRQQAVATETAWALDHGAEVHLVTLSLQGWSLDPRVKVHELRPGEAAHPVLRAERLLVHRLPQLFLQKLAGALRRLTRTPAAPVARKGLAVVRAVEKRQKHVSSTFSAKIFMRGYKVLRPFVLWRVADRKVLPAVGVEHADQVVVQDAGAITLGWHLARRYPDLDVAFTLDRSRIARETGAPAVPVPVTDDVAVRAS
jgi:hypothetical protein